MLPKLKDLKKAQLSMPQEISMISKMIATKLKVLMFLVMVGMLTMVLNSSNPYISSVRGYMTDGIANLYGALKESTISLNILGSKGEYFFKTADDIAELITENDRLKQQIHSLNDMVKEVEQLRKLMNVVNDSIYEPITARVVSESYKNGESRFLINAGSERDITEGMAVINEDGFIGRIIEVNKQSARVMTIQDEQSSIPAITKPSNKRIIGGGSRFANVSIKYLDGDIATPKEVVQTSNDGDLIPSGLDIGFISEDGKSIVPNFKLQDLDYVLVLKLRN